jgi:integrase
MSLESRVTKTIRHKGPRLKLDLPEYTLLRNRVLERDRWRCQDCGLSNDMQVHHPRKRSRLGDDVDDVEENMITLCASCHQLRHCRDSRFEYRDDIVMKWAGHSNLRITDHYTHRERLLSQNWPRRSLDCPKVSQLSRLTVCKGHRKQRRMNEFKGCARSSAG